MLNRHNFKLKPIAAAVASTMLAGLGNVAVAQDTQLEEVVVTGIRASLERAMDIKRESAGVVDAISAEDIGKFPDTNLAESLQRISGVSISRVNGEGSEVTVRGFGAEYNLITLNGRHMPGASVYAGGGSGGARSANDRAFDFANLASESVSGVEVYKTGRASVATGGIGATVNIKTRRPLDSGAGFDFTAGVKAVHDTTVESGDDVTPELSALTSFTNDSETFGVAAALSFQERNSSARGVDVNEWFIGRWDSSNGGINGNNGYSFTADADIENPPEEGQLFGRPADLRYTWSDFERERINGQVTVQFAPTEALTGTVDYTYAENKLHERRGESTSWFANGNSIDRVVFDDGAIRTPVLIHETVGPRDQGFEQQLREHSNELESFGVNLEFAVTDSFTLTLDAHDSEMSSLPAGPGNTSEIAATVGIASQTGHTNIYNNGLPIMQLELDDCIDRSQAQDGSDMSGDCSGDFSLGDVGSQVVRTRYVGQVAEIQQIKLDGALEFDNGRFDFGIETREMTNNFQDAQERYMEMGGWGIRNIGDIDTSLLEMYNLADFDDYDTSSAFQGGIRGNAEEIAVALISTYGTDANGYELTRNPILATDDLIEEDTTSLYFQVSLQGELGDMATNLVTGLRYEETDVYSRSLVTVPVGLMWLSNNDFNTDFGGNTEADPFEDTAKYDVMLPSLDFDIEVVEDVKARFSYSKTIGRAGFADLRYSVGQFGSGGGSTILGSQRTASGSNPKLVPLESNNIDVSVEWYYDDASYASFGIFEKRVDNFIGRESSDETHFGMVDQTAGPRAEEAVAELNDAGIPVDDTTLFTMMAVLNEPQPPSFVGDWSVQGMIDAANSADPTALNTFNLAAEEADVSVDPSVDPIAVWNTSRPVNNQEAKLYGAEFGVQHFFGDTGFGVIANYTIVRGDIAYDVFAEPGALQLPLFGLSDSANLVAVYENYGWSARLAYNWRDEYLRSASEDGANNPIFVEAYDQIDLNVSYDINDNFSVFAEGLNITGEDYREHQRTEAMVQYMLDLGARYQFGARYNF